MTTPHAYSHHGSQHERWLLSAAQRDDRHAVDELIRRYEPLVRATTSPRSVRPIGREREDLAQAARSGLWRAIRTWQPHRGPFRAYANACVHNSVVNEIHASGVKCQQILNTARSLDIPAQPARYERLDLHPVGPHVDLLADPEAIVLLRERLAAIRGRLPRLTDRERRLLAGALNGKTQKQLADEERTSWQAVNCAITRLRAKLAGDPPVL